MNTKLKLCPFCGGEAKLIIEYDGNRKKYKVKCICGGSVSLWFILQTSAIRAWNTRITTSKT